MRGLYRASFSLRLLAFSSTWLTGLHENRTKGVAAMGDKGGKKDKAKDQKQKAQQHNDKEQKKKDKQPKSGK
jgi:hypothetical protein